MRNGERYQGGNLYGGYIYIREASTYVDPAAYMAWQPVTAEVVEINLIVYVFNSGFVEINNTRARSKVGP
jgi:hypothetical protein